MKKSFFSRVLALIFFFSLIIPVTVSMQSCGSSKYQKSRNGGAKVHSSGTVGSKKHKNSHVWGK